MDGARPRRPGKAAQFDTDYLHLDRAKDNPDTEAGKRLKGLI